MSKHWEQKYRAEHAARVAAEAELERNNLQLRQSAIKMEEIIKDRTHSLYDALFAAQKADKAKSAFLANVSHEIRTPLNEILGFSTLLAKSELPVKEQKYVDIINYSATNLLNIINDILDYSKIESGRMEIEEEAFAVDNLVHSVWAFFHDKAADKQIDYQIDVDRALPECVIGDSLRLHQILSNLIDNAIKFTDQNGKIIVAAKVIGREESFIKVRFSVSDTGIGIPASQQADIFSVFTQADSEKTRVFGGAGLGLSLSSQLVDLMGSRLDLESDVDVGSRFWFDLRMDICSLKSDTETVSKQKHRSPYANACILVVEDMPFNQELMRAMLEDRGIRHFDIAADGTEAVRLFLDKHYDLILMDINMPNMDGMTATVKMRQIESKDGRKKTPIVALTAYITDGNEKRFADAGMDGYIAKPIRFKRLDATLSQYLGHGEMAGEPEEVPATVPELSSPRQPYSLTQASRILHLPEAKIGRIVTGFLEVIDSELTRLETAIVQNDPEAIKVEAHRIKGSAGNFQMQRAEQLAREIEMTVKFSNINAAKPIFDQLVAEFELVKNDLNLVQKSEPVNEPVDDRFEMIDPAMRNAIIRLAEIGQVGELTCLIEALPPPIDKAKLKAFAEAFDLDAVIAALTSQPKES